MPHITVLGAWARTLLVYEAFRGIAAADGIEYASWDDASLNDKTKLFHIVTAYLTKGDKVIELGYTKMQECIFKAIVDACDMIHTPSAAEVEKHLTPAAIALPKAEQAPAPTAEGKPSIFNK